MGGPQLLSDRSKNAPNIGRMTQRTATPEMVFRGVEDNMWLYAKQAVFVHDTKIFDVFPEERAKRSI
jgi:hypothetical protein